MEEEVAWEEAWAFGGEEKPDVVRGRRRKRQRRRWRSRRGRRWGERQR